MRRLISGVLFVCFMVVFSFEGNAQETMKAKKMEGHSWHQVVLVRFEPGTMDKAKKLIDDHFAKAGMEAGIPGPKMMTFKTGEWDMMFVWTMDDIGDMNWEISPNDEKWWAAMVAQEGGEEQATKVWQDYLALIDNSTSYLATSQEAMEGETVGNNNEN